VGRGDFDALDARVFFLRTRRAGGDPVSEDAIFGRIDRETFAALVGGELGGLEEPVVLMQR